ncbi:hypothetical protein AAF712_012218 [Marasmius tenuissimus]|uniref:Uncharacterized protein n=1 Tax=Marasmius tenuissimus TaxID=585030 RepID=A0ABR2ZKK1_9AGAR
MSDVSVSFTDTVTWRAMEFEGQPVTMDNMTDCFKAMEQDLVALIMELMFGKDLRAGYGTIHEDLTNTSDGFGFITNPANLFYQYDKTLWKAIITDPELQKKWFLQVAGTGQWMLNALQCRKYLSTLAKAEGILMVLIEMTGGAPPRITEITSLLVCNTPFRTRNMMMVGDALSMVRMYDKTTNLAQKDRHIPHALAGLVSDIFIQVHVLMRPFARWISLHLYPNDTTAYWTYRDHAFANLLKPFDNIDVRNIMVKYTEPICGWGIGPRDYRQINTGFRRMLCAKATSLIEIEAGTALSAAQAGHDLRTESRIYANTNNCLISLREDMRYAFAPVTRQWQRVTRVPPSGLDIKDYRELHMDKFDELEASSAFSSELLNDEKDKVEEKLDKLLERFERKDEKLEKHDEKLLNIIQQLVEKVDQLERAAEGREAPVSQIEQHNTMDDELEYIEVDDPFAQQSNNYHMMSREDERHISPKETPSVDLLQLGGPSFGSLSQFVESQESVSGPSHGTSHNTRASTAQAATVLLKESHSSIQLGLSGPSDNSSQHGLSQESTSGPSHEIPCSGTGHVPPPARYQLGEEMKDKLRRLPHAELVYDLDIDDCPLTALDVLQALYGPDKDWHIKEQQHAVEALMQLNQDVIVVFLIP